MAAPVGAFHSRPVLAAVIVCHLLAGVALFQVLDRAHLRPPEPITVTLIAEPPPAETPPEPLPQADVPPPVKPVPKVAAIPPAPAPVPEPPPQPVVQPEPPPPVRQVQPPPEPPPPPPVRQVQPTPEPPPPPPVRQVEPRPEPVAPPSPVARAEPEAPAVRNPEPVRPATPTPPAPVTAVAPAVPAASVRSAPAAEAPVSEPLYGADYLHNPKPDYPLMSRRRGEEGVVLLRVFVTADGDPREVQLKEGSGHPRLDRAAQEIVQKWKFIPAKRGNQPVDAWVVVPIRFSLKG